MPNVAPNPQGFFRQQTAYVPKMQYSADVNYNGGTRVDFGIPIASSTTNILNALAIGAGNVSTALDGVVELGPATIPPQPNYGRVVTVTLGASTTTTVTLNGYDYLGQPLSEDVAISASTTGTSKKAFKSFRSVNTIAAVTLSLGWGPALGLPYKALRVQFETNNGVFAAAGTLTAPVLTDPQTAITGDPRGTYTPTTTPNGVLGTATGAWITAVFDCVNDVNAAGNGGLHGIQHYAA